LPGPRPLSHKRHVGVVMAEQATTRVARLLGIMSFLSEHGTSTEDALAQHFGVSREQLHEDLVTLWVSGLPGHLPHQLIDFDGDALDKGIVRLTESQGVRQVRLSTLETVALVGALDAIAATASASDAAATARDKLVSALGNGDMVRSEAPHPADPAIAAVLRDAIERAVVVSISYVDAAHRRTERTIEPHHLVVIDGDTYVECYCQRAQDYRTFRVDRILSAQAGQQPITTPPGEDGGFSLNPRLQATVRARRSARWLFEALPGVHLSDDGTDVVATFGVADTAVIASQLLCVGPQLVSIQPEALAHEVARQANAVIAAQA